MDLDFVSVHKNAKRELGQYPAILTSRLVNNIYIYIYICNGNRTEWSPIRSVIIRLITKSDDRAAGVRFVYHEYDYRPNWTTQSPITN